MKQLLTALLCVVLTSSSFVSRTEAQERNVLPPQPEAKKLPEHQQEILDLLMDETCEVLESEYVAQKAILIQKYDNFFDLDDETTKKLKVVLGLLARQHAEYFRCTAVQNSISDRLDYGQGNTFELNGKTICLPDREEDDKPNFKIIVYSVGPTAVGIRILEPVRTGWSYTVSSLLRFEPEKDTRFTQALGEISVEDLDRFRTHSQQRLKDQVVEVMISQATVHLNLTDEQAAVMEPWIKENVGDVNPDKSLFRNVKTQFVALLNTELPGEISNYQKTVLHNMIRTMVN